VLCANYATLEHGTGVMACHLLNDPAFEERARACLLER
jgi:hypothetical protein